MLRELDPVERVPVERLLRDRLVPPERLPPLRALDRPRALLPPDRVVRRDPEVPPLRRVLDRLPDERDPPRDLLLPDDRLRDLLPPLVVRAICPPGMRA